MRPDASLRAGFVVPLDIPAVLKQAPPFLAGARFCLLTSIDSIEDLAELESLRKFLSGAGQEHRALGKGLLLDADALHALLADDNYFTGFDELWLFPVEPTVPKPDELGLTTVPLPWTEFRLAAEWMAETDCTVGLGDGSGLAYVTNDAAVAGWIASLET